jgi:hypothetical protein
VRESAGSDWEPVWEAHSGGGNPGRWWWPPDLVQRRAPEERKEAGESRARMKERNRGRDLGAPDIFFRLTGSKRSLRPGQVMA